MATPPATRKTSEAAQMTDEELSDPVSAPPVTVTITSVQQRSLESQLKQAMMLASTRSALLLENESRLMACHGRIKLLEKTLEDKEEQLRREKSDRVASGGVDKLDDNILSVSMVWFVRRLVSRTIFIPDDNRFAAGTAAGERHDFVEVSGIAAKRARRTLESIRRARGSD